MAKNGKASKKKSAARSSAVYTIQSDMLVVAYLGNRLEEKAAEIIYTAGPGVRNAVAECVIRKLRQCLRDLEDCRSRKRPIGPDCPKGSHEYMGRCVPDDPDPNG